MVKCMEKKKLIVASIPGWVLNYGLRIPFQKMLLIVALISSQFKFDLDELIESLCNLSNQMPEDGSTNWDLPPRFDDSPDEADEMVQDHVADLPLARNFN